MADKASQIYYTDNDKNINISFHKMTNWKKVTNIKTVDLFHNRSTVGTFIILKALFISDPSVKLICKAINFINFLSIMPSLQWRILSQEAAAAARVRILENAVLKRSHEKFKISILVYRFLVWIWLGGQDSDSLYQHTAYALHTTHNTPHSTRKNSNKADQRAFFLAVCLIV